MHDAPASPRHAPAPSPATPPAAASARARAGRAAPTALAAALAVALLGGLAGPTRAQETALPDIGSSAGQVLSPADEARYGAMTLRELRRLDLLLEDPLLDDWLDGVGHRLGAASDVVDQPYTFFLVRSRQINAFATLGGYIGVNAGLVLTATREDEVASVMAHEIAHVTQRHVLRSVERAQRDAVPIMLGMLAAIAAASASNSSNSGAATQAAIAGGMGLIQQRQINYTRSNEYEADRLGIQTLARAGYDPDAMGDFFAALQRATRSSAAGYEIPEYLRTHPITITRIGEARDRAATLDRHDAPGAAVAPARHPLLPGDLASGLAEAAARSDEFPWALERIRVLSAGTPQAALLEYRGLEAPTAHQRYGQAIAQLQAGRPAQARELLAPLLDSHPGHVWVELAMADAEFGAGQRAAAVARFEALLERLPRHRAASLAYARRLIEAGGAEDGRRAAELLRPLLGGGDGADPAFQRSFARASELAGDTNRAAEAHAEAAFLGGRVEDALNQLEALKRRDDVDYYQRARVDARIAEITPIVLEMRRQGLDAGEQGRRGDRR